MQKVLELYNASLQNIKKIIGKTTVVKDVKYGPAERNVLDVSCSLSTQKYAQLIILNKWPICAVPFS